MSGHCHHDLGLEDEEGIVQYESSKYDVDFAHVANQPVLYCIYSQAYSNKVVGYPVLGLQIDVHKVYGSHQYYEFKHGNVHLEEAEVAEKRQRVVNTLEVSY